jgi:N-acyl-D-aspartate/D-glutamate deacylase
MADTEAEFDLVIRGGRVVDGTRMPSFVGDVAVKDGKVAATGRISGKGRREIDATGLIVAPGFIDVHTHYDAQLQWDPYASQSCWHGVTTVVISLCGFGFAPCKPEHRERAMQRMTRVETIPYEAMKQSMRWDWVNQNDMFNSLERSGLGVNVAGYIPHSAVRAWVLHEEDTRRAEVTPAELEQMKELVRDGYRAGALGLSTDHNLIDRDYNGDPLPSMIATREEVEALLSIGREFNVGSVEVTPANIHIDEKVIAQLERYAHLSGRPCIHTAVFQAYHVGDQWKRSLDLIEEANQRERVYGLGIIHRIGSLMNLLEYNLFDEMPAWNAALNGPIEERIARLRDPAVRAKLQHDLDHHLERVWSGRWDKMTVYSSSTRKDYEGRYLSAIAESEDRTPLEVFCDLAVAERLETYFYIEDQTSDDDDANAVITRHPFIIPGVSDGGAHAKFLSMGKYPTVMLSKWVRDEKIMSLEEAHWRLSHMSAAAIGLEGIGTLEPGMPADIVVYDLENLKVTPDWPVYEDIIAGGRRLVEKADGYRAIIVNGVITFEDGECTRALPGRVLRTSAYDPGYFAAAMAAE